MRILTCVGAVAGLSLLTGCFDDKYDLSDIDDTIGIEVKDLVIPVNMEPVEFSSVIDLDDEEGLEINEQGQYVIRKGGSFNETVHINSIEANPDIDVRSQTVTFQAVPGMAVDIHTQPSLFDFTYKGDGSSYILTLDGGETDMDMTLTISLGKGNKLEDVEFSVPEGLYGYYDTNQGRKEINENSASHTMLFPGEAKASGNGDYVFVYHVTRFDAQKAKVDYSPSHFTYTGKMGLIGGKITTQSNEIELDLGLKLLKLEVKTITGDIIYTFQEFDHQTVNLGDLPDVLKDPETNVTLINPQVYFQLNNPIYEYGLSGSTGLIIRQLRDGGVIAELPKRIPIVTESGRQNFLICPDPDAVTPIAGYTENLSRNVMPNLGKILSGHGLPSKIDIEFVTPGIERGHVTNFRLGYDIGTLVGEYTFYAPLAFGEGSQVVYTGESHDWGFGDEEDFEISALSINAHLKSDLPVSLTLTAEPIDKNGNVIKHNGKDVTVTVTPAVISANADRDIEIAISGGISHLDGIRYTAKVLADQDASTLRPDMSLKLTDIRAKVSGKYVSNSND